MAPPEKGFKPLDLPKSNFDFANSFDGSAIPPPPPSPPPQAKPQQLKLNGGLSSHPTTPTEADVDMKDADSAAMPPPAKKQSLSPASPENGSTKRPSSVRKLLSLRSLREKDRNHQALSSPNAKMSGSDFDSRPGSPYGAPPSILSDASARPSLAKKRSSGWFGSRRKSGFFGGMDENSVPSGGAVQPPAKPKGPPPPTIPEFKEFQSINGALSSMSAEDLFKDIK